MIVETDLTANSLRMRAGEQGRDGPAPQIPATEQMVGGVKQPRRGRRAGGARDRPRRALRADARGAARDPEAPRRPARRGVRAGELGALRGSRRAAPLPLHGSPARRQPSSGRLVAPAPLDFRGSGAALRSAGRSGNAVREEKNHRVRGASLDRGGHSRRCTAELALRAGPRGADRVSDGSRRRAPAARGRMVARASLGRLRGSSAVSRPARDPAVRVLGGKERSVDRSGVGSRSTRSPAGGFVDEDRPRFNGPPDASQDRVLDGSQRTPRGGGQEVHASPCGHEPPEPAAVSRPSRDPHPGATRAREAGRSTADSLHRGEPRLAAPPDLFFLGCAFSPEHRGAEGGGAAAEVERSRRNQERTKVA